MNQQSSKKILFNKSTLFNLKAELLKKQEEVLEKKQLPQNKVVNYKPPVAPKPEKEKTEKFRKKSFKDGLNQVDVEELEACRKAKVALEKKAELYDHLNDGVGSSVLADRFLVDFETKKQGEVQAAVLAARRDDDVQAVDDGDDEWAEFTDCLGRTRKCHKTDLEMFRKKDLELKRATFKDQDAVELNEPEVQEEKKEPPLLVQKTNEYLNSLREKWDEKERELVGKDRDIHYQDLLYDEARIHGVGYYAFSTDDKERRKQMEELMKQREETLQAQKQTEELRRKREEVMAARIKAARARQRARAGLPPEEPEEEDRESFTTRLLEFLTKQRDESEAKANEEQKKKKEEEEKEKQKLREAYVREWDLGKEGVKDKVKQFREMTQEEYVEQQRDKRIDEFAPFQTASSSKSNYTFNDSGSMVDIGGGQAKTWSDVRPKAKTPMSDLNDFEQQKGLYFSSKQQYQDSKAPGSSLGTITRYKTPPPVITQMSMKRDIKYKNFVKADEPTPIVNELSDDEDNNEGDLRVSDTSRRKDSERTITRPKTPPPPVIGQMSMKRDITYKNFVKADEPTPIVNELSDDEDKNEVGVRVSDTSRREDSDFAPPPTYEYYGPVPKRVKHQKPFESDIREAFDQGKKSLEAKPTNRQISKDYDFTFG